MFEAFELVLVDGAADGVEGPVDADGVLEGVASTRSSGSALANSSRFDAQAAASTRTCSEVIAPAAYASSVPGMDRSARDRVTSARAMPFLRWHTQASQVVGVARLRSTYRSTAPAASVAAESMRFFSACTRTIVSVSCVSSRCL